MFVASKNRRMFHRQGCRYVNNIKKENRIFFIYEQEAVDLGWDFCPYCSPIMNRLKKEEKALTFASEHSLQLSFCKEDGALRIASPSEEWKLFLDGNQRFHLYHKSEALHDTFLDVPGFHDQRVNYPAILLYLEYIVGHYEYRQRKPFVDVEDRYLQNECSLIRKSEPRKGTRRYRAQQRRNIQKEHNQAVRNVLALLDSLQ